MACRYAFHAGSSLLLPERRATETTHRGPRRRLPGGIRILPDQRRDDPTVQGERRISHGKEESVAGQAVAEEGLAFLRGTGELESCEGTFTLQRKLFCSEIKITIIFQSLDALVPC